MLTTEQATEIEFLAMRGKAVASLLGTVAGSEECAPEDISMSAYALECYFTDILKTLEPVETEPKASLES